MVGLPEITIVGILVDATEVGVSLKRATVKIAKAACDTTSGSVGCWGDKPPL